MIDQLMINDKVSDGTETGIKCEYIVLDQHINIVSPNGSYRVKIGGVKNLGGVLIISRW
jgi:hypothetical protein